MMINRTINSAAVVLALLVASVISGCTKNDGAKSSVIRVGEQYVSVDEFLQLAKQQGTNSPRGLKQLAQATAEDIAAERKLIAQGWDRDPAFIQARRRFIRSYVHERINRDLEAGLSVSEAEIEHYFQQHKQDYGRAEQVRVALIEIAKNDQSGSAKALAEDIHATIRALPVAADRNIIFNRLAAEHSAHLSSRYRGGDIGYVEQEDPAWPPGLTDAVFSVPPETALGDIVETADRFYVFYVLGKREALTPSLAEHREKIHGRILAEKHDAMRRLGRERLVEGVDIDINTQLIDGMAGVEEKTKRLPAALPAS